MGLSACAQPNPGGPASPQVTCQGQMATVKLREAEYTYDCGLNAACVAGSPAFSTSAQICKGQTLAALTCADGERTRRCEGETLFISCPDGSEEVIECLRSGRRCMLYTG
jgi:hypothetical protein